MDNSIDFSGTTVKNINNTSNNHSIFNITNINSTYTINDNNTNNNIAITTTTTTTNKNKNNANNNIINIEDLHEIACNNKLITYIDPITGYNVFTKYAHIKRGKCCGSKCRHCPYDYCNVKK